MADQKSANREPQLLNIWPALVDVTIATLMILLLFMVLQHIVFFLSDALKRMEIRSRQDQMVSMIKEMEASGQIPRGVITCETLGDRQKLRFASEILFPLGRAEIPPEETERLAFLDAIGTLISRAYYEKRLFDQIYIEGHTDIRPIKKVPGGRFQSNWDLSAARAVFVTNYLVKNGKLLPIHSDKRFLGAAGYGEFNYVKSVDDMDTNRRIEILLVYSAR